ncbi:hypothetical protein NECAME_17813, partial [Necator americanus]
NVGFVGPSLSEQTIFQRSFQAELRSCTGIFKLTAMHYALIVVVLAATLMECSVALPDCGKEMPSVVPPLDSSTRTRLSDAVHGKAQGGELEYNCHLEYLGWLALNDPSDSELGWLPYEDTYLLNFRPQLKVVIKL